jgi:hypothetical protein
VNGYTRFLLSNPDYSYNRLYFQEETVFVPKMSFWLVQNPSDFCPALLGISSEPEERFPISGNDTGLTYI